MANLKTVKHHVGTAESAFVTGFISLDRFIKFLIQEGGIYSVIAIGLADSARAAMYWWNVSKKKEDGDSSLKIYANLAFYTFKAAASITGVGLVYAGMILGGFAAIILGGMVATLRHGFKAVNYWYEGNEVKAKSNGIKTLLGAMIVTGFVLYAFFPELMMLSTIPLREMGYGLVIAATSYILGSVVTDFVMEQFKRDEKLESSSSSVVDVNFIGNGSANGQAVAALPGQGGTIAKLITEPAAAANNTITNHTNNHNNSNNRDNSL